MSIFLKTIKFDISSGGEPTAVMNQQEAENYGIQAGDKVELRLPQGKRQVVTMEVSHNKVGSGQLGLWREAASVCKCKNGTIIQAQLLSRPLSIQAIRKKLLGEELTYNEVLSIISDIVQGNLSAVETTYYVASGFVKPNTDAELFYLSKAIAETGEQINLPIEVVDKHSIGGLPGNRTTMVVTPIISSLGLYMPKTSSRAITSPAGTADTMEVLAPVSFSMSEIRNIVKKTHACLVWGGGLNIAPADDRIIKLSRPLALEPYDKMLVSIMAKKVAMGVDYLVIDMPIGATAKVKSKQVAKQLAAKFVYLGRKFNMKVKVIKTIAREPIGRGVGPALEARDVLRVLQQKILKPDDLEQKSIYLAGELLELKGYCRRGEGERVAKRQLVSGSAWKKMQEIIAAQGGNPNVDSEMVASGTYRYEIHAHKTGRVSMIDNRAINEICMNLGAPREKLAGLHMHIRWGQPVNKGDKLFTLYALSQNRLDLGMTAHEKNPVVSIA